jgi:uncharacterized YccA/Bax inhibitor family protein
MTVGGAALKSFLLLLMVVGFAVFGWNFAVRVVATTSGMLFLVGYIILIALTFAAVSNPRLAPLLGVVYAALMGTWMGAISQVYESSTTASSARRCLPRCACSRRAWCSTDSGS